MNRKSTPSELPTLAGIPGFVPGPDGAEWLRFWLDQSLQGALRQMAWWSHLHHLNEQAVAACEEALRAAAQEVEQAGSYEELSTVPGRVAQRLAEVAMRRASDVTTASVEATKHWVEETRSTVAQGMAGR